MARKRSSGDGLGWVAVGGLALAAVALASAEADRQRQVRARQQLREKELEDARAFVYATLHETCRAFGIAPVPLVFVEEGNAASDGHRVYVNLAWFDDLLTRHCGESACTMAVARWVLAHEIAHHVHRDADVPLWVRNSHGLELRADYYAGRALAHFGAEFGVLDGVLREIAPFPTQTHPAFHARLRASHDGFRDYVLEQAFRAQPAHALTT